MSMDASRCGQGRAYFPNGLEGKLDENGLLFPLTPLPPDKGYNMSSRVQHLNEVDQDWFHFFTHLFDLNPRRSPT